MTEIDQKQKELQAAVENFSSCLKRIEAGNSQRLEGELEKKLALIHKIRAFTAQGCFFRAFSPAERRQLLHQLEERQLEMGKCAPQLREICDMIENRLEQQRRLDKRRLAAIQKAFSPEEYQQYESMFCSDIFLNYLGLGAGQ